MVRELSGPKAGGVRANFDYGGPLSELAILANISLLFPGKKLEWDPVRARFPNCPEADAYIKPKYRQGWSL